MFLNNLYYTVKPLIPRSWQIMLRRQLVFRKRRLYEHVWPIEEKSGNPPKGWCGWPDNKRFAVVLTHDVDTLKGHENCKKLMDLEKSMGFRSSFNFVPERYDVSQELRQTLAECGFEVGVHGLRHDGKLYGSRRVFEQRAHRINHYLKKWESVGFRSPSMHHNLDWLHELNIEYDASTFDTDPFEPQSDALGTIFPLAVYKKSADALASPPPGFPVSQLPSFFVELPYTLPQDFTVFILMKERTIDIWKQKLDWIAQQGGMALLLVHPDYMNFHGNKKLGIDEYPAEYYKEFLSYVKNKYGAQYWHVLPKEIASYWASYLRSI